MNKKLASFLLATTMVFQTGLMSFAEELSENNSKETYEIENLEREKKRDKSESTFIQGDERKMSHSEKVKELVDNGMAYKEAELAVLINEYRMELGLRPLKVSKSLTKVARTHVKDSNENFEEMKRANKDINFHSWSDKGEWSSGTISKDSPLSDYEVGWDKPRELTNYKGNGYEISTGYTLSKSNNKNELKITPKQALDSWKSSPAHNNTIITEGHWKDLDTFGVGIDGSYSHVWFGEEEDPDGYFDKNPDNPMMTREKKNIEKSEAEKVIPNGDDSVTREKKNIEKSEVEKFILNGDKTKRIAADNRILTAIEISKFENKKADKVILADASNYPDALSASTLTNGKYPVLLINKTLKEEIKEEIKRLEAKEVIILGGKNAIPSSVENELENLSKVSDLTNINRISGRDRFETSNKVFLESGKKKVVLASGSNFPDALSASSLLKDAGLVLVGKAGLTNSLKTILSSSEGKLQIIGGQNSIGQNFYENLPAYIKYKKISSADRYSTSVEIAKNLDSEVVIIASGENFPDALAASTLSQKISAPVLLVSKNKVAKSVERYIRDNEIKKAIILGGQGSISNTTANNIERIINGQNIIEDKKIEKPVQNETFNNIKKNAVTKSMLTLYKDEELTQEARKIQKNKIVDILEIKENLAKIKYNDMQAWTKLENLKAYSAVSFGKVVNNVPYISQLYPVYAPNGCEPAAMLMGLKAKGYTNIGLRAYLDKMPKSKSNPKYGYVGQPYNVEEGRFQTIDPEALAKYGRVYGNVANIQGAPIEEIIKEIQNGNTVVVYATLYWNRPYFRTLKVDGKATRRIWNNHAILLTGYDPVKRKFYVADPYNHEKSGGNRRKPFYYWKDESIVNACYNYDNRRFAVVVR